MQITSTNRPAKLDLQQVRAMLSRAAPAPAKGPKKRKTGRSANCQVELTCQDRGETLPTRDPCDRAHDVRDKTGFLMRADQVANATPRRYPPHQLTAAGVSHDTHAEEVAFAERRLKVLLGEAEGKDHGGSFGMTTAEAYHEARRRQRVFVDRRVSDLPDAEWVMERYRAGAWKPDRR